MRIIFVPFYKLLTIAITIFAFQSYSVAQETVIKMGGVQIRPEGDFIYVRARSGGDTGKTPFGLFAFNKTLDKWETIGTAANFSTPVDFNGNKIDPESFFYSRQGYESLSLGSDTYTVGWKNGRAFVTSTGTKNATYESDAIKTDSKGSREYLIKYFYASKIWFDMRVLSDSMLYSEGIGCFDILTKKITIYTTDDLGFKPGGTIITRMTGRGEDVWIGVSFCDAVTCLEHGAVSIIKNAENKAQVYTSDNSPLPTGAVLDIVPDGKDIWIATATGFLEWNPEAGKARNYRLSGEAVVLSKSAILPSPGKNETIVKYLDANTKITIQTPAESGFYISTPSITKGWLDAENVILKIN